MKSLKFGNVVLCDYVGRGHANKYNLVNAISGDVIVASMPADLMFGLYMELISQREQPSQFKLEIMLNKKVAIVAEGDGQPTEEGKAGLVMVPFFPIQAKQDSVLEAYVSALGFKKTLAMRKRIYVGPLPVTA